MVQPGYLRIAAIDDLDASDVDELGVADDDAAPLFHRVLTPSHAHTSANPIPPLGETGISEHTVQPAARATEYANDGNAVELQIEKGVFRVASAKRKNPLFNGQSCDDNYGSTAVVQLSAQAERPQSSDSCDGDHNQGHLSTNEPDEYYAELMAGSRRGTTVSYAEPGPATRRASAISYARIASLKSRRGTGVSYAEAQSRRGTAINELDYADLEEVRDFPEHDGMPNGNSGNLVDGQEIQHTYEVPVISQGQKDRLANQHLVPAGSQVLHSPSADDDDDSEHSFGFPPSNATTSDVRSSSESRSMQWLVSGGHRSSDGCVGHT